MTGVQTCALPIYLNQWIKLNEIPKFEGQPYLPKAARNDVERLLGSVKNELNSVAQQNTSFGKSFAIAEDLAKGLYNSYSLGQFFKNNTSLEDILSNKLSKLAFGYHLAAHPGRAIGVGAAAFGGNELLKLKQLLQIPEARKAYAAAIKAAAQNDIRDFAANASKFDKYAKQIEG